MAQWHSFENMRAEIEFAVIVRYVLSLSNNKQKVLAEHTDYKQVACRCEH